MNTLYKKESRPVPLLRDGFRDFVHKNAWVFLSIGSVSAFALTASGSYELFQRAGQPLGIWDAAYYGLIGFVFNAPVSPGTPSPLALEIGRLLAPATLATAAISAFSTRLIILTDKVRARRMSGHTIIVGLSKAGALLAERLAASGSRVILLESNAAHPRALQVRSRRIAVVTADASVPANLELAGIGRAKQVISLAGKANQNAAVAAAVNTARQRVVSTSRQAFHSFIEIDDHEALRDLQQVSAGQGWSGDQEFFSLDERAAQLLVSSMSLRAEGEPNGLLITGSGALALWVLSRVGRERTVAGLDAAGPAQRPLRVRVIVAHDDDHELVRSRMEGPWAGSIDLSVVTVPPAAVTADLPPAVGETAWSHILIADMDEIRRLRLGLAIRSLPGVGASPTTIIAEESASLDGLAAAPSNSTRILVLPEAICHEEFVTWGRLQDMARSIHEGYLRRVASTLSAEERRARTAGTPWESLTAGLKAQNMGAAKAILRFLRDEGYVLGPLRDLNAALAPLPDDVVERIAEKEHERWRLSKPDAASREAWSMTSASNRTLTLEQIRQTPALLAFAGLQAAKPAPMTTKRATLG